MRFLKELLTLVFSCLIFSGCVPVNELLRYKTGSTDPLCIGVVLALSGADGAFGTRVLNGVSFAADELNAGRGHFGRLVKLAVFDSAGTAEGAVRAFEKAVETGKEALDIAVEELKACGVDGVYFGDAYASESELITLVNHRTDELLLKLEVLPDACDIDFLFEKSFVVRPDLNSYILRMTSLRGKGEISAFNCVDRKLYDVTIDNSNFKRYAGEINIVLKDLPKDDRVNVIGKLNTSSVIINKIKEGVRFKFIK